MRGAASSPHRGATTSCALGALGVQLVLEVDDDARCLLDALAALRIEPSGGPRPTWRVTAGPDGWWLRVGRSRSYLAPTPSQLLAPLLDQLNRQVIRRSDHVAIHAGGVTSGDRGVLLTGPTEAGKSTLTAGLVLAGMSYLGDEAIGIDASTGRLLPYAKPLSLDVGSQPLFAQLAPVAFGGTQTGDAWHLPVDAIRSGAVADGASLAHVVLCRYVPGAATTLTELSRAEALVELASLTFRFPSRSRRSLDVLAAALSGSTCHRLVSGDLDEAVASVSALIGSESAHARDAV